MAICEAARRQSYAPARVWQQHHNVSAGAGASEQKAKNLEHNRHCILTTGRNSLTEGLDLVVEGDAVRVTDEAKLRRLAAAYESKYGRAWHFDVRDRAFVHEDGGKEHVALVFEVNPAKALGFRKGEPYSQTRWRFARV